ncbi:MAG: hypothetical protein ACTSPM_12480 [Candidatus Heimdallarchaeota archaeon]
MLQFILSSLILLANQISPETHIMSFAFCPFIFGGTAIYAIVKWVKLESGKKREVIWSISIIVLAVVVIVFVGLNTFYWQEDLLFYIFIVTRFTLLIFLAILANPYIKWAPFKNLFITKEKVIEEK